MYGPRPTRTFEEVHDNLIKGAEVNFSSLQKKAVKDWWLNIENVVHVAKTSLILKHKYTFDCT